MDIIRISGKRVLAVIAHPDDETIFMGGTILSHPECIWRILCATYVEDDMRAQESLKAIEYYRANGIRIEIDFLGHRDERREPFGGINIMKLETQLAKAATWPDMVISHNEKGDYNHNGHIAVYRAVHAVYSEAWEILCEGSDAFPSIEREECWSIPLSLDIQRRKRQIFEECYLSQQILWEKAFFIVDWAFSRNSEIFGRRTL